jgi:hypothetical protein
MAQQIQRGSWDRVVKTEIERFLARHRRLAAFQQTYEPPDALRKRLFGDR